IGRPLADADIEHLALPYQVVEGAQRLLERGLEVEPVGLVQVDVVGLQAPQRPVERLHDVLAGQAAVVLARAGRPVDLGADLHGLAAHALQRPPEDLLRLRARVHVGRVEGGDALVQGRVHAGLGRVLLDLGTVREPVAVSDLADHEAASAEMTEFHGTRPYRSFICGIWKGYRARAVPGRHRAGRAIARWGGGT